MVLARSTRFLRRSPFAKCPKCFVLFPVGLKRLGAWYLGAWYLWWRVGEAAGRHLSSGFDSDQKVSSGAAVDRQGRQEIGTGLW